MDKELLPAPVVFETERLYIREFCPGDVPAVYAYSGDAENTVFMDWGPESLEGVSGFIDSRLAEQIKQPRRVYDLAVCLKEDGSLIGSVGLYLNEERNTAELGWIFNKAYWHMGFASEAARGALRYGFLGLELHRIYAKCDEENTASFRVMERIGMRLEAHFRKDVFTKVRGRAGWRSTLVCAMLRREYLMSLADGEHDPACGS